MPQNPAQNPAQTPDQTADQAGADRSRPVRCRGASRALAHLTPDMRARAGALLAGCEADGLDMLVYCTYRAPEAQAALYRQSRPLAVIRRKMARLEAGGFGFLARMIARAGPRHGPHVTNAGPGESWHNYGMALDAAPLKGGKCCWSVTAHRREWALYGAAARRAGLEWAGDWRRWREYPHVQMPGEGSPLRGLTPDQVRAMLAEARPR